MRKIVGVGCFGVLVACTGPQGPSGAIGEPGEPVQIIALATGDSNCPTGGTEFALDSGSAFACNGAVGPTGAPGAMGAPGVPGAPGDTGPQGPQGVQGPPGPQGDAGEPGPAGPQGLQGEQGPAGPQGIQGEQGPAGPQGIQGEQGPAGPQGLQGDQGPAGPQGIQGEQGPQGIQGEQGPQGPGTTNGNANYVGKFTSSVAIGNSLIQDNGTGLSVNYPVQASSQFWVYRQQQTSAGDGQSTLMGYRDRNTQNVGTSYGSPGINTGVAGLNFWGDDYSFAVTGHNYNDFVRTGGVLGSEIYGAYWGTLGYKASSTSFYGVYGTSAYASGTGRRTDNVMRGVGGGFYGDLIGGWMKGDLMGTISSGSMFAAYNKGDEYTVGRNVELVPSASGRLAAAYPVTGAESRVYADGKAVLRGGTARVTFDAAYAELLGEGTPTVTLTPVGGWANLYLVKVDRTGFTVADASGKARSLEFHWIALGARAGERRVVPAQIANGELDRHLDGVLFNEALTQQSGQPMWFDGKALRFDAPPATSRPKDRR